MRQAEWLPGEDATVVGTRTLPASEESFARLFAMAQRKLTPEVARAYVRLRLAQDKSVMAAARLEAYSLSARDKVMDKLDSWASGRKDELRQTLGRRSPPSPRTAGPRQDDPAPGSRADGETMTLPEVALSSPRSARPIARFIWSARRSGARLTRWATTA